MTGIDREKFLLVEQTYGRRMIRYVGLLYLENVGAAEYHILHRLIHRRWLSLVETARGEFHARAEIAGDVGGSREYVSVLR
jgi:hypothetical protein